MKAYLIAGEMSGDLLGAALMQGLKSLQPEITFDGIGGDVMQAEGLTSLFDMTELSVMGIAEVLPKYRHLKRRIAETAKDIIAKKPDVLITIDSPDFCLRVARSVKAQSDIRVVHYVAPSVWAWRPGRAKHMAEFVDQVLALLPFEPPYMEEAGMRCDFVGHPVVTEPKVTPAEIAEFRMKTGLGKEPVILVLPGSRKNEVERLTPIFGQAIAPVLAQRPKARVLVPAAGAVADQVTSLTADWPGDPIVLDPREAGVTARRKHIAFATADVALAASGTVSLELAAAGTPMVIGYDMSWMTWQIKSLLVRIDTVTLVNLVSGRNVVPEFLGPNCRPDAIGAAVLDLLENEDARGDQISAMAETLDKLGQGQEAPGLRAARAVLDGLTGLQPPQPQIRTE